MSSDANEPDFELRRESRRAVSARAVVYAGAVGRFCTIVDYSDGGCQIVGKLEGLPEIVHLHLVGSAVFRPARVKWRRPGRVGLAFVEKSATS